ncbi:3-ketoacyl-ACP reductase [Halocella sp. SP3-1]|uniref:3-ketoacyl-ACP reductase n=1 Tax=Halocella sp. SP3-1 TaxID=2382161 RepID=UPI000F74CE31|nr:3-ketoacyl-ACP reductase [Halocella sp. SP3-1]AZO94395.1 3-ketoacyl-ACP reductase [Halocella sp. SP3-1]
MIERKVAVITGASRGIGHAVALQLAREGFALAILARSSIEKVKDKIEEIKKKGVPVFYYSGDLSSAGDRGSFLAETYQEFGRLDLLVNNAGVAPKVRNDILETSEESFNFVLNINLKGTFFLTQAVAKIMLRDVKAFKEKDNLEYSPRIINISSLSSYASSTDRSEYCISKAGISMLTRLFADRLAEDGIYVYEIRPGIIYTDMTSVVKDKYDRLIKGGLTPIKRWGYPADIANAVSVLCSGRLNFSTGEVINVDGGFHLRRL